MGLNIYNYLMDWKEYAKELLIFQVKVFSLPIDDVSIKIIQEFKNEFNELKKMGKLEWDAEAHVENYFDEIEKIEDKLEKLLNDEELIFGNPIDDVNTADVLTRCIQESITNAIKHSQSKSIHIAFAQTSEQVTLSVEAELSKPLKSTKTLNNRSFKMGNGLLGMQERLKQLKGTVTFELSNEAFITNISIPVSEHD